LRFEKEFRVHSGIDFNAEERSACYTQSALAAQARF